MNHLKAVLQASKFSSEPHLVVLLDEEPLDAIISRASNDAFNQGLVSALDRCFFNPEESQLVWSRILPEAHQVTRVPFLVCPDDLDFYCTVVIAEVFAETETITWTRLGFDGSDLPPVENIGTEVTWIKDLGPFVFRRTDYMAFLEDCKALGTDWWEQIS
jgi:hypothetical protein